MSNNVFANGFEIACKKASGKSICAFPDVVWTPPDKVPPTPTGVPVPYPNTAMASDTSKGSKKVKITGAEVMLKNKSCYKKSMGNEAGVAQLKGFVTMKNTGKAYFVKWSMDVKVEGQNVDRHFDLTTHNHGSLPPNSPPMVYVDSMGIDVPKTCEPHITNEKEACEGAQQVKNSNGRDAGVDCDKAKDPEKCKAARACLLPPYDKSKKFCCTPDSTGHHVIPKAEFLVEGSTSPLCDELKDYKPDKAPCVCAEGYSWHSRDSSAPLKPLKLHGVLHREYKASRRKRGMNVGDSASYNQLSECGVEAMHEAKKECASPEGCTKDQLDHFHITESKVPRDKPVCRVSRQLESDLHRDD